jgi:formylglycine-generating enzyme required for sulfatase activity
MNRSLLATTFALMTAFIIALGTSEAQASKSSAGSGSGNSAGSHKPSGSPSSSMTECESAALESQASSTALANSEPEPSQRRANIVSQVHMGDYGAMAGLIDAGMIEGGSIKQLSSMASKGHEGAMATNGIEATSMGGNHKGLKHVRIMALPASPEGSERRVIVRAGKYIHNYYEVTMTPQTYSQLQKHGEVAPMAEQAISHYRSVPTADMTSVPHNSARPVATGLHGLVHKLLVDSGKMTEDEFNRIDPRSLDMIEVGPGTFRMGSSKNEPNRHPDETQHQVTITKSFEMGKTQVTQALMIAVMGENPSHFKLPDADGDHAVIGGIEVNLNHPAEKFDRHYAKKFLDKLSELDPDYDYRFASEAERQYIARAGTTTAHYFGDNPTQDQLDHHTWNGHNSEGRTHAVGQKPANAWGFLDIEGNVYEWVGDWYAAFDDKPVIDPLGPASGSYRVLVGGSWIGGARVLRVAFRGFDLPGFRCGDVGLRLVRVRKQSSR